MRSVAASTWRRSVEAARDEGYRYFDWLGVVDEIGRRDTLRVVVALRDIARSAEVLLIATEVPRDAPRLESIREVFAGASWHEREAAELFGVDFGREQPRLLLNPEFEGTPLRKDQVLAARTGTSWPGGKEPGESDAATGTVRTGGASPGRRRMVPPGVPDPAVWGDRDEGDGVPDPAEVADAVTGRRVRRRRP